ncbi:MULTISPECIES: DUF3119 family protein [unclassified Microcoleus]|uniref:DUF3119 family protein n=1 Tax=unclassified Microcoleus TaxID=2642155 RepID=UPI002FD43C16
MNSTASSTAPTSTIELAPSYALPLVLVLAAVPLLFVQKWASLSVSLFGLFLMYQAATLRLQFTPTDLDIYRSSNLIRRFPYREWQNWRILWPAVPIWFYFKEINSIHSFPILFDRKMLQTCLEQRCPRQD